MRFVFLGYDLMLPLAKQLINDGHELLGIMSFPCDQHFNFNLNCQSLSKKTNASYIESPIQDIHIDSFIGKGATLFISAGYPHKVPPINPSKAYGINIHPSYLPYARGPMPIPHIIINEETEAAGYTIHKLAPEFDAGDILFQQHIELSDNISVEKYCAQILANAPKEASRIIANLDHHWAQSSPQDNTKASSHRLPDTAARTLNWSQNIEHIQRTQRAFGHYGCFAQFGGKLWTILSCEGWTQEHEHKIGTCVSLQNNMAIIAAKNGFIALTDFEEVR